MSNDKMREEFEEAFHQAKCQLICVNEDRAVAWAFFAASREALVIELPDDDYLNRESAFVQGYIEGVRLTKEAIEAAGVKVKP